MPELASFKNCTGCRLCQDVCAHGAISFESKYGFSYPHIDKEKCINCNLCESMCPETSSSNYDKFNRIDSVPYAVWSKEEKIRKVSASGGAFAELAASFFQQYKGSNKLCCVIGATIDGKKVRHIVINSETEISLLQGTKYLQSDIGGIYKATLRYLIRGYSVLFSGLPCQVNALYKYLANKEYNGYLMTCDLICNGVPSSQILDLDIKYNLPDLESIISFRDKISGWENSLALTYKNKYGKCIRVPIEESLFLNAFRKNFFMRNSCYNCNYCHIERKCDFTLGDWWGCNYPKERKKDGVSLVVCHNQKAETFLKNIGNIHCYKIKWKECLPYNPRLFCGKRFIGYTIPSIVKKNLLSLNYNTVRRLLTSEMNIITEKRFWWLPFKVWQIFLQKVEYVYRKKMLTNVLKQYE